MPQTNITNLDYLKDITDGEPEILKEFINMFFDQLPEFKDGMTNALKEENWEGLCLIAHKAKSSVMTFGMNELGLKLKTLQLNTLHSTDIDTYKEIVDEFIDTINKAEIELYTVIKDL
jgi:HPt (histidine-containing phosphotransfer) domain-containing protein